MDVQQVLKELKKEYINNAKLADVTNMEKTIAQMKNSTNTNKEQMVKTQSEVKNAKKKIIELEEALRSIDATNTNISKEIIVLEERFISLERDNWKHKRQCEGNREKVKIYTVENKGLFSNFLEQEERNGKIRRELGELNKELKLVSDFMDKILESNKKLWTVIGGVQDGQKEVENFQKTVFNRKKHETALKDLGVLTKHYKNKLERIENEKMAKPSEYEKYKVEYDILKNSVEDNSSESSILLAKMFKMQFKNNHKFFRNNVEDQEFRMKRLRELLKEENEVNTRLKSLLRSKREENEKNRDSMLDMITEVKDETILIETADSDNLIENL